MSQFSAARQEGILAEARSNLRRRDQSSLDLVFKTKHDACVPADDGAARARERSVSAASESEPWWGWVERFVDDRLSAAAEGMGQGMGECLAELRRELTLLQRELTQLREQVGLERGLRDLRSEVEQARSEVPKVPALVGRLEEGQARLQREVARTKDKVSRVRTNQSISDYRLSQLSKATAARSASLEMKIETSISSFEMREIHPDARAALRDFAAEALKGNRGETLWFFDPGPTAGTA